MLGTALVIHGLVGNLQEEFLLESAVKIGGSVKFKPPRAKSLFYQSIKLYRKLSL
jgi:hypothetical protein